MTAFKLYHWTGAKSLARYSKGDIIVMANSIADARWKAHAYMRTYLKVECSWWFDEQGNLTEYWKEEYEEFERLLKDDLAKDPDVVDPPVIFLPGSE